MNELPRWAELMVPMGCKVGDLVDGSFGLCVVYRGENGMLRLRPADDARADFEVSTRAVSRRFPKGPWARWRKTQRRAMTSWHALKEPNRTVCGALVPENGSVERIAADPDPALVCQRCRFGNSAL